MITQPPKCATDQSGQPICSAIDCLVQGRRLVSDREGLVAFTAGFHHAAHIVIAAFFVTVLVAQMYLHSRDVIAELVQDSFHYTAYPRSQRRIPFDVMVGIYLDLHSFLL